MMSSHATGVKSEANLFPRRFPRRVLSLIIRYLLLDTPAAATSSTSSPGCLLSDTFSHFDLAQFTPVLCFAAAFPSVRNEVRENCFNYVRNIDLLSPQSLDTTPFHNHQVCSWTPTENAALSILPAVLSFQLDTIRLPLHIPTDVLRSFVTNAVISCPNVTSISLPDNRRAPQYKRNVCDDGPSIVGDIGSPTVDEVTAFNLGSLQKLTFLSVHGPSRILFDFIGSPTMFPALTRLGLFHVNDGLLCELADTLSSLGALQRTTIAVLPADRHTTVVGLRERPSSSSLKYLYVSVDADVSITESSIFDSFLRYLSRSIVSNLADLNHLYITVHFPGYLCMTSWMNLMDNRVMLHWISSHLKPIFPLNLGLTMSVYPGWVQHVDGTYHGKANCSNDISGFRRLQYIDKPFVEWLTTQETSEISMQDQYVLQSVDTLALFNVKDAVKRITESEHACQTLSMLLASAERLQRLAIAVSLNATDVKDGDSVIWNLWSCEQDSGHETNTNSSQAEIVHPENASAQADNERQFVRFLSLFENVPRLDTLEFGVKMFISTIERFENRRKMYFHCFHALSTVQTIYLSKGVAHQNVLGLTQFRTLMTGVQELLAEIRAAEHSSCREVKCVFMDDLYFKFFDLDGLSHSDDSTGRTRQGLELMENETRLFDRIDVSSVIKNCTYLHARLTDIANAKTDSEQEKQ